MNTRTKLGLDVLEAALLLGLLGDALLRATPWGLNLLLWVAALTVAFVALLARWRHTAFKGEGRWLILPVIFGAAAFAWRDSATLNFLAFLMLLSALSLAMMRARGLRIRLAGITDYMASAIAAGFNAFFGSFPLIFSDVHWKEIPRAGWSKHLVSVLRGLMIAVPLLLLFGALFMAADAVFEGIVNCTISLNFDTAFSHVALLIFTAWLTAGFLRIALIGGALKSVTHAPKAAANAILSLGLESKETKAQAQTQKANIPPLSETKREAGAADGANDKSKTESRVENKAQDSKTKPFRLGIVEVGLVIGLLDALFLLFVLIQIRYFFGGSAHVQATTGLTYAEYARRGFFELVWVAALVLPILLIIHHLLNKDNPAHERIFRWLAGFQIVLLFIIMASAVGRMRLYQSEYGLTELRLYTTAFMGWLAIVFIWFVLTVLRGQRERFACGALVAGYLIVGFLHSLNPDALIVTTNLAQARRGHSFDAPYAAYLSADAVPVLMEAWPTLPESEHCYVSAALYRRWFTSRATDWRTWNLSRSQAQSLVRANAETLRYEPSCVREESTAPLRAAETNAPE